MPDLPEPEEEDYYGSNVCRVRTPHEHVGVRHIGGYIQSSIVGTYGPEEAREVRPRSPRRPQTTPKGTTMKSE